jgi:hypothetical protein
VSVVLCVGCADPTGRPLFCGLVVSTFPLSCCDCTVCIVHTSAERCSVSLGEIWAVRQEGCAEGPWLGCAAVAAGG